MPMATKDVTYGKKYILWNILCNFLFFKCTKAFAKSKEILTDKNGTMAAYISVFTRDCLNLLSLKRYLYDPIPNLNPLAFVSSKLNITVFIMG